ncbi:MAG: CHAT domain-containing protein [Pseudomonadota bacterium]
MRKKDSFFFLAEGNQRWFEGKPHAALSQYEKARDSLSPDASIEHRVDVLGALALAQCEINDFASALALYPEIHEICISSNHDPERILRQWAKALEQTNDFDGARATYEKATPTAATSADDRLKWHHAVALLDWRDGRLTDARDHLVRAVDLFPDNTAEAVPLVGILGNAALFSIELGNVGRAMRLADRMSGIIRSSNELTLSNTLIHCRVRAALARLRGDQEDELRQWKVALDVLEVNVPADWARRLDIANEYVLAAKDSPARSQAIADIGQLVEAAPPDIQWLSLFFLGRLLREDGDLNGAKTGIERAIAAVVGSGSPESEVELILDAAELARALGKGAAAILLGKISLELITRYVATLDPQDSRTALDHGQEVAGLTTEHLRAQGRYEEAQLLAVLSERVAERAIQLRNDPSATPPDVVPWTAAEAGARDRWLTARQEIAEVRSTGADTLNLSRDALDRLLSFEAKPDAQNVPSNPLSLPEYTLWLDALAKGDVYELRLFGSGGEPDPIRHRVSVTQFNRCIAELRDTVTDHRAWRGAAEALAELILKPFLSRLATLKTLEVDGSGPLVRVPFGLLPGTFHMTISVMLPVGQRGRTDARAGRLDCTAFAARAGDGQVNVLAQHNFSRDRFRTSLMARPNSLSITAHLDCPPTQPNQWALILGDGTPLYLIELLHPEFDLAGIETAILATCASGVHDVTDQGRKSFVSLTLEKGVTQVVGTLWDISQSAADSFVEQFWQAHDADPGADASTLLAQVQARARAALDAPLPSGSASGIGARSPAPVPEDWAGFVVFKARNISQQVQSA